jgi:hypothetical protein
MMMRSRAELTAQDYAPCRDILARTTMANNDYKFGSNRFRIEL